MSKSFTSVLDKEPVLVRNPERGMSDQGLDGIWGYTHARARKYGGHCKYPGQKDFLPKDIEDSLRMGIGNIRFINADVDISLVSMKSRSEKLKPCIPLSLLCLP